MEIEENNYSGFINSYDKGDYRDAHDYFLSEIGGLVVNKRSDFVHLLNESGIQASESMSDEQLIKLFVEGLSTNKNLKLGASILFETSREPIMGADGYIDETANDAVIKASYELMDNQYSSSFATPLIVKTAAKALRNRNEKKNNTATLEQKKIEASAKMKAQAELQRKKLAIEKQKIESIKKASMRKTLVIGGSIVLGIAIIGIIIYKTRK